MQIRSDVSPTQIREAVKLSHKRSFWLRFIGLHWYAVLLAVVAVGSDLLASSQHKSPKWDSSVTLLVVAAGLLLYSWFRVNARISRALRASNARIESKSLDTDGVRLKLIDGATGFVPWSGYTKWREGKSVFLLTGKNGPVMVPVDDANRETVRGLLSSQISQNR